ncbi:YdeI/OmpD-associated family protein [Micromonospora sp. NBC_00898]|uniref:YdeI/OmpD-associated family protein n=1 Tax=Micromonospora sp. NBC_00898 TaxID=2975981 RepID=UPI003866F529|nr:YdeI/OmpD-associated family protein [Micromonospora sp. NBC_00898]
MMHFANAAEWESWLADQHGNEDGVWLKIAKKGSAADSVTIAALAAHPQAAARFEALDKTARYLVILPLLKARTPAGRAARLAQALAELLDR